MSFSCEIFKKERLGNIIIIDSICEDEFEKTVGNTEEVMKTEITHMYPYRNNDEKIIRIKRIRRYVRHGFISYISRL